MPRLDDLKARLTQLTATRNERVAALRAEIDRINHEYDTEATRLSRAITRLEPVLGKEPTEPVKPKRQRATAKPELDIWARINEWNQENQK